MLTTWTHVSREINCFRSRIFNKTMVSRSSRRSSPPHDDDDVAVEIEVEVAVEVGSVEKKSKSEAPVPMISLSRATPAAATSCCKTVRRIRPMPLT
jgi:hypothetical protein